MLAYQLRLAWRSLRRNPVLSVVLVIGIGLGIGVAMTFVTAYRIVSGDPIPEKSTRLHYVQMDAWNPERPYDSDLPDEPPIQLTYRDALAAVATDIPTYQTPMYKVHLTIHPEEGKELRPFRESTRLCHGDFFRMFDTPFAYGGPWSEAADEGPEQVVILGEEVNLKLFGGEDSVGRTVKIEDREFKVVGVLSHWQPIPKYYDTNNNHFGDAEQVFLPFRFGAEMELRTSGNTSGWAGESVRTFADRLESELIWTQAWVQLDTEEQREEYMAYLNSYADEQRKLGRFQRPNNNRIRDVRAWLTFQEVTPPETKAMMINALLFLLVCSVNLIGILLGKFLARAPEVGVRRALGASRRWVFLQHLIECELIGILGCLLGVGLTALGVQAMGKLYQVPLEGGMDMAMLGIAMGLALVSALIAGIYPAWRICRIAPGMHLKTQ